MFSNLSGVYMKLFSRTKRFLNRLTYSRKFSLIGLILMVPLVTVNMLYLNTIKVDMETKQQQLEGAEYNLILKDILQYTQQTRALNVKLVNGDTTVKSTLDEKTAQVEANFKELEKYESNMKFDFNDAKMTKTIQTSWNELQGIEWNQATDILTGYSQLIEAELAYMKKTANESGLLLADSKEDYNLIYIGISELPSLTEKLGQMRALGINVLNEGKLTDENETKIEQLYYPTLTIVQNMQEAMAISLEDEEISKKLSGSSDALKKGTTDYLLEVKQLSTSKLSTDEFYNLATETIDQNFDSFNAIFDVVNKNLEDEYESKVLMKNITTTVITMIFLMAITLFSSLYLSIKETIKTLAEKTAEVASGNLTVKIDLQTKDEMNDVEQSFNQMTNNLHRLVEVITTNSSQVVTSSEELMASAQEASATVEHATGASNQVAQDTDLQMNSLKESANAMDDMVIGIEKIADNSRRISELTDNTTASAIDGNKTVERALTQMTMIQETVTSSSETINELNKQSEKIGSIVNVITGIADQTNLLALNAAIEAARAGEHGKGFAVVADEVRKLAEDSRSSAAQITELITVVQLDTTKSVSMMGDVSQNVAMGIEVTKDASAKFGHILTSMEILNPQMAEISTTAMEFSAHAEQVAAAMNQLLETSKQTSAATEEIASSSEEQLAIMEEVATSANALSTMAESLQDLIKNFKL